MVRDLPALLRPGDVLVVNDTRVIPARLTARRGDARIGIMLDQPRADGAWHALVRNARRLHAGDELRFDGGGELRATVVERDADGGVVLAFDRRDAEFAEALRRAGALALPPYIARPAGPLPEDRDDYQTVFAARDGAVAAPTAGLHFTPALLAALERRGVRRATVTLHVGAGTFLPVRGRGHRASTACMPNGARSRRGRRRDQRRARGGRARGRGRHHRAAPAGDRGRRRMDRVRPSRRYRHLHRCPATASARSICC